ncbi:hypothetical protein ACFX1X_002545 [Malus domestica]
MTWQDQSRLGPPSTRPIVHTVRIYLRLKCGRGTQRARERSETKPGRVPGQKTGFVNRRQNPFSSSN